MKNKKRRIIPAKNIGFCFGVRRTVEMAQGILAEKGCLASIGDIVHNPDVMHLLKSRGLAVVTKPGDVRRRDFIIRSHGLSPCIVNALAGRKVRIHDATCPYVKKLQGTIKRLDKDDYFIIIIGDAQHPEVQALRDFGRNVLVVAPGKPVTKRSVRCRKLAIVGQTTLSFDEYAAGVRAVVDKADCGEVRIFNTICKVTEQRQEEARRLSRNADCMIVCGGRKSANTRKLYQVCRRENRQAYRIESLDELRQLDLSGCARIGITSGTSTSGEFIDKVVQYLKGYFSN